MQHHYRHPCTRTTRSKSTSIYFFACHHSQSFRVFVAFYGSLVLVTFVQFVAHAPQFSYSFLLFVSLRLTINKGLFDDDPHKGKSGTVGPHVIDFCRSKDICLKISFCFLISNVLSQPIFCNFKSNRECAWFVFGSQACDSSRFQPNMLSFHAQMAANSGGRYVLMNFCFFSDFVC